MAGGRLHFALLAGVLLLALVVGAAAEENEGEDKVPSFRWAQRKDRVLLTIDLQGVTHESIELREDGRFVFEGTGSARDRREERMPHKLELQLLKPINTSDSTCGGGCTNWIVDQTVDPQCTVSQGSGPWEHCTLGAEVFNLTHCQVRARDVHCVLIKQVKAPYWPHLLKDNAKPKQMSIDWSKWLDEEQDGVRWNNQVDRAWEWWKHDGEDDDDEETEDARQEREREEKRQRDKYRRARKKKAAASAS
uniref:CS domain-containing protein n=2 Tax=Hemiselmis andersenii TaxID=464988 RepID=A0A7S1HJZ5_HEMAN|mmetsp:Transcript_62254/g.149757  ORF Transcript_62254/g.149757 Transcript_62254/m.149757 type:complete len:249 (+) Transcript_62254:27-773(+)